MAAVPVTLTINFVSNYAGQHRVCVSIDGNPYDCTTLVTCLGFGSPCSAVFNTTVDNETCADVVFDVYVQPTCEPIESLDKRTSATYTFTPSPACKKYTLDCINVPIESITLDNPGTGYTAASVSILGGGGAGATATATVVSGSISVINITNYGSGYTSPPAVNISGDGMDAAATAVLDQCGSISFDNCIGTYTVPANTLEVGDSIEVCSPAAGGPVITSQYTKTLNGNCLCDCEYITVTITDVGSINYYANTCNGGQITGTMTNGDPSMSACVASGSFYYEVASGTPVVGVTTAVCPPLP